MIDLISSYFGASVSSFTVELTAAVLLIGFVLLVCSSVFGIFNQFFRR